MIFRVSKVIIVIGIISKLEIDRTEEVSKLVSLIILVWKKVFRFCFISKRVFIINLYLLLFFIMKRELRYVF